MKKIFKFYKILTLLCLSLVAICSFVACNKEEEKEPETPQVIEEIVLNYQTITLEKLESATISATLKNLSGSVAWESSDGEIVSVSNGVIEAKKEGVATITASVEDIMARCYITVTDNKIVPVISCNVPNNIGIIVGGETTVKPTLSYNGKEIVDSTFSYEVVGEDDIISVDNSLGVISASKIGDVQVKINASYKGLKTFKILNVSVVSNMNVTMKYPSIELKTAGTTSDTSCTQSYTVFDNNKKLNALKFTVVYQDYDSEIIKITGNKITALKKGETNVSIVITSKDTGNSQTQILPVKVSLLEKDLSATNKIKSVYWNTPNDYQVDIKNVFNDVDVSNLSITSVYDIDSKKEFILEEGKISIAQIREGELLGTRKWRIQCEKYSYIVSIEIGTMDPSLILQDLVGSYNLAHDGKNASGTEIGTQAPFYGNSFRIYKSGDDYRLKWEPTLAENISSFVITITPENNNFGQIEAIDVYLKFGGYYSVIDGNAYLFLNNRNQEIFNYMYFVKDGAEELDETEILDKITGKYSNEEPSKTEFVLESGYQTSTEHLSIAWVRTIASGGVWQNANMPVDVEIWEIVMKTQTTGYVFLKMKGGWITYTLEYTIDGENVTLVSTSGVTVTKVLEE